MGKATRVRGAAVLSKRSTGTKPGRTTEAALESETESGPETKTNQATEAEPASRNGKAVSVAPGGPGPGPNGSSDSGAFLSWLNRKFATSKISFFVGLAIALALWASTVPIAYWSLLIAIPNLWDWVDNSVLRGIAALFGSIFLIYPTLIAGFLAYQLSETLAGVSLASDSVAATQKRLAKAETEAIETEDEAELLPLLRYSRAQLEAYYDMSRAQTRRSFLNAVIAMWLGFVILLVGIGIYIAPIERFGIERPSGDANIIILASAVIVEFISTLFLWVYRSTVGQLTYYYRLQMQSHTAVLCFRMAKGMTKIDEARIQIITHLLDSALTPERPRLSGGRRLFSFLKTPLTDKTVDGPGAI